MQCQIMTDVHSGLMSSLKRAMEVQESTSNGSLMNVGWKT